MKPTYRTDVRNSDPAAIRGIVQSTGFFSPAEVDVAVELAEERLARGEASGYHFLIAEIGGRAVAYACFGPIACTAASYDLYWIAVHEDFRGQGIGRELMLTSEARIAERGGTRVYIETSSRAQYQPTRSFYRQCGYIEAATLEDFYAPGDAKVVYLKIL